MAHELDPHVEWQRLYELYHAMADDELLELAEKPDDLTDIARDVMMRELKARRLELVQPTTEVSADQRDGESDIDLNLEQGVEVLTTFQDTVEARTACECLEEEQLPFKLYDLAPQYLGLVGGPRVSLQLVVREEHLERAKSLLRAKMGLFPLAELERANRAAFIDLNDFCGSSAVKRGLDWLDVNLGNDKADEDDFTPLGFFETLEETDDLTRVLEQGGVRYRVADKTGEMDVEKEYRVEVQIKGDDLPRAAELLERGLPMNERE